MGEVVEPGIERDWGGSGDLAGEQGSQDDAEEVGLDRLGIAGAELVEVPDALEAFEEQLDLPATAVQGENVGDRPGVGIERGDQEDEAGGEHGPLVDRPPLLGGVLAA